MELRTYLSIMWRKRCLILAAFLSTLLATSILTFLQKPIYEATSTFVVSPTGTYRDAESLAGVLDAMSRRAELANTYAEVASSRSIKEAAADDLDLSRAQREDLAVESRLLANTNVLEITVQGSDAQLVTLFADQIGAHTANYTRALYESYGLRPLDMAVPPTKPVKPSKMLNLALGAALGLGLGLCLAFLAVYLEAPLQAATSQNLAMAQLGDTEQGAAAVPRTSRFRILSWIVVVLLTLGVIGMGSVLFLSGPRTSASVLPVSRSIATFVPAAVWTPTPTAAPAEATLLAASPTPTMEISPTPCAYPLGWVVYEVQVEDTLSSLADRYDMSVAEIVDANCLTRRVISAGQLLYFPPPETATPVPPITTTESVTLTSETATVATEGVTVTTELSPTDCIPPEGWTVLHVVQLGDSLYSLALAHGVSVEEIVAANCLESTFLSAGHQQLYLPPPSEGGTAPGAVSSQSNEGSTLSTAVRTGIAGASLPAPVLTAPADRAEFPAGGEIVLAWQPVPGLPADGYYAITVAYSHRGETWYDEVPWTRDISWTLSEHDYLLNLSDDGQFTWSVQVVRETGTGADGSPEGETLSEPSARRRLTWKLPSTEGGGAQNGTPPVPPP